MIASKADQDAATVCAEAYLRELQAIWGKYRHSADPRNVAVAEAQGGAQAIVQALLLRTNDPLAIFAGLGMAIGSFTAQCEEADRPRLVEALNAGMARAIDAVVADFNPAGRA